MGIKLSAGLLQALQTQSLTNMVHHLHIPWVPLHIQSLAVDLQVILFTFLRGGNRVKLVLEAADVALLSGSSAMEW